MKNYMKTVMETYFVRNLITLTHVYHEDDPGEVLKRNGYALLNVAPRAF